MLNRVLNAFFDTKGKTIKEYKKIITKAQMIAESLDDNIHTTEMLKKKIVDECIEKPNERILTY